MKRITLPGLRADLPIGAMAAFGTLRVCDRTSLFAGAKLSWERSGASFHAVLSTPKDVDRDALIDTLVSDVGNASDRLELLWSEQIKTATPETLRQAVGVAMSRSSASDRESADWFAAFGTELSVDDDGAVRPTPFDMSVARQKFLLDAAKLAGSLAAAPAGRNIKSAKESYAEALFGPWKYEDDQHSLGWDPSTMKLGAFTFKAPTAMANTGVRAAVWLAFESLPLFPCFYNRGLETRSFHRDRRELALCWPIWHPPISLPTLATLLGWAALLSDDPPEKELRARGVAAVYRSTKFKPNKYLASFRTPVLAFGGAFAVKV